MSEEDYGAFVEELVSIAHRLHKRRFEADPTEAIEDLARVQEIADSSRGIRRALAEVAAAFLYVITGEGGSGVFARAVYGFLRAYPDSGRNILRESLSANGVGIGDGLRSEPATQRLLADGVLIETSRPGHFRVRPSARTIVRDAVGPLHFRVWEGVQSARDEIGGSEHDPHDEPAMLAGKLGCTRAEAADHLSRFPLRPKP